ncbi:tetraspanin-8-like [Iris pallida]|uniref:Tetraspanin-8-like n=1 Tax=Iris pallida TaxID=29817 RepID=A0AAX6F4C9_IRIPA|nr:tetraspanin-8-like [Iris pallida]
MFRLSNKLVGVLNLLTFLLSIPILAGGVWLSHHGTSDCDKFLQGPVIAIGVFLMAVSLAGLVGACCRNSLLLWVYLCVMFLLILLLLLHHLRLRSHQQGRGGGRFRKGIQGVQGGTTATGSRRGWTAAGTGIGSGAVSWTVRSVTACRRIIPTRRTISSSGTVYPLFSLVVANHPRSAALFTRAPPCGISLQQVSRPTIQTVPHGRMTRASSATAASLARLVFLPISRRTGRRLLSSTSSFSCSLSWSTLLDAVPSGTIGRTMHIPDGRETLERLPPSLGL